MNEQTQLKLQAFLDGELPEKEAREMSALVARDQDAAALLQTLRHTHQALAGFEADIKVPDTREFYWSRIEREIRKFEESPAPAPAQVSFLTRLNRFLLPLGGVAAIALALLFTFGRPDSSAKANTMGEIELASNDMSAVAYRSHDDGVSVVWLYDTSDSQFTDEPSWNNVEIE